MNNTSKSPAVDTPVPIAPESVEPTRLLVVLALFAVYVIWGSTYLAIHFALESWPPFMLGAIRFLLAGAGFYAFLRLRGTPAPTRIQWINAAISGALLLSLGNGLVCFAEQSVASGLAAVAVASMPLFAALFGGIYREWPRSIEWLGLAVGFIGVILLNLGGGLNGSPLGALALITAAAGWAFGSVWSRRRDMPPASMNTAAQMLCGGAILAIFSLILGERLPTAPTAASISALLYLAVFGSIIAFTAYLYLLQNVRPLMATSYAYVNPPVAVLIGALFAGEVVHLSDLASMAIILAGVALITLTRQKRKS